MTKLASQLEDLQKSAQRLQEALQEQKDDIVRDAVIKRFEFTFELTWKTLQTTLQEEGMDFVGVKTVFRNAAKIGLIHTPEVWFTYLEARNLTTHSYDLEVAEKVYTTAREFSASVEELLTNLKRS